MSDTKYEKLLSENENGSIPDAISKTEKGSWCSSLCKFVVILLIATIIVFSIIAAAAVRGGYYVVESIIVPRITADHPLDLPTVTLPSYERHSIEDHIDNFFEDLDDGKIPKEDLVLTEHEINGILNHELRDTEGKVYVTMTKNLASVDFSFPAGDVPGGNDRYFVGTKTVMIIPKDSNKKSYSVRSSVVSRAIDGWDEDMAIINATADVDADDGFLDVHVRSAEVMGWMATPAFVHRFFDDWNVMDEMCSDMKNIVKHIEGVEIDEGKIIVRVSKK